MQFNVGKKAEGADSVFCDPSYGVLRAENESYEVFFGAKKSTKRRDVSLCTGENGERERLRERERD